MYIYTYLHILNILYIHIILYIHCIQQSCTPAQRLPRGSSTTEATAARSRASPSWTSVVTKKEDCKTCCWLMIKLPGSFVLPFGDMCIYSI